ncbi:cadmium resistance transporter [Fructilactobacillus carniphilus]|uniref:Cadmium resistance transporter n=1 Tax=Fructilactobacillus carniphilus TaxID=2940297 RepID=A0ABY5BVK5_9LACO|nr:cadmium resistance transporter [Fructilactobacillus carniphilus]USS90530.1 cadmium resistance transporter [Fructilactobacillus carniphilus]
MNWWLLTLTFIAVNLDFFVLLLFFLKRFSLRAVLTGYWLGMLSLLVLSYVLGQTLEHWLPEWLLGGLGFLPIYLAIRGDEDEDAEPEQRHSAVITVLLTYLTVCAGCNLSVFIPVLLGQSLVAFLETVAYLTVLTVLVIVFLKRISQLAVVNQILERYGDRLMRFSYLVIGLYVLFDSGFITHIMGLIKLL